MRIEFTANAWADYCYWSETDPDIASRIPVLIEDIRRDPFKGLGKPEPLRHQLAGYWSRRINNEDRLVYAVSGERKDRQVTILTCRYHYDH